MSHEALLAELVALPHDATSHERRAAIGDQLAAMGDTRAGVGLVDGIPDVAWLRVAVADHAPFFIAQYPVTNAQYRAFSEADYDHPRWWDGFPEAYQPQALDAPRNDQVNAPRDSVSWYQAMAFVRWLDVTYRERALFDALNLPDATMQIRLPTESEWLLAANNGEATREYPWGGGAMVMRIRMRRVWGAPSLSGCIRKGRRCVAHTIWRGMCASGA